MAILISRLFLIEKSDPVSPGDGKSPQPADRKVHATQRRLSILQVRTVSKLPPFFVADRGGSSENKSHVSGNLI